MTSASPLPGFLAGPADLARPPGSACRPAAAGLELITWAEPHSDDGGQTVLLSPVVRRRAGRVESREVAASVRTDPETLTRLLPPFAVVATVPDGLRVVADSMGLRHLHLAPQRAGGVAALASSALALGRSLSAQPDQEALGIQSLLGWQLGDRTVFHGVRKLPAGAVADLTAGGLSVRSAHRDHYEPIEFAVAVSQAAQILQESLGAVLDDHPGAVLQLTGGMDSRLLLSAVPVARRRGLRAMTLSVPGSADVATASAIAQRYGLQHDVHGIAVAESLEPATVWATCLTAAERLDAMSDPVALTAQLIAERAFDQGVRISGLGGEVARGFYYGGKLAGREYSRSDAVRLADWRMFVNDAVEPGMLSGEFTGWARKVGHDAVYAALREGGDEWLRATDWLYLRHRMQRWAGATDVAVSAQRTVINPMLDPDFITIAQRLTPQQKRGGRFLAALQMELDPDLGRMPLDGRPAPAFYADPPRIAPIVNSLALARRAGRKLSQRLHRGNRPPAGGVVVAAKVVEHWRREPQHLESLRAMEFVEPRWIERVLAGEVEPRPSSVAFLTNLLVTTS